MNPCIFKKKRFNVTSLMDGSSIPQNNDVSTQMLKELFEEGLHLYSCKVLTVKSDIEGQASLFWRNCNGIDGRYPVLSVPMVKVGSFSLRCPCAFEVWDEQKPTLVDKDEVSFEPLEFFLYAAKYVVSNILFLFRFVEGPVFLASDSSTLNLSEFAIHSWDDSESGSADKLLGEGVFHCLCEIQYCLVCRIDAILLRDVVKRYKVRSTQRIYDLATYLVSNFSSAFSFTRLRNILGFRSTNTVEKYLKYLEESYLVFSLNSFSFKVKEQIRTPRKVYLVDNGFILAKSFQFSQSSGKLMENLAFVEILRKGYKLNRDIFYYKATNGSEVDFVLRKGIEIEKLMQVCYRIDDIQIKERELKGLIKAGEELNCNNLVVITWDYEAEEEFRGGKINFIPLWKWLLGI